MESIKEIENRLKSTLLEDIPSVCEVYEDDERAGVKKAIAAAMKRKKAYDEECIRTKNMQKFEAEYANKGYTYICGIDEVGRGPLAGPVVAAAVILPIDHSILYLNDSKKLSEKKREELYDIIMDQALAVGIGYADEKRIDEINILQADYEAMRMALSKLKIFPDLLLNDAVTIPEVTIPQVPIIKGDAKSASIAAASIVAKVTRDRLMMAYEIKYPGYHFAENKGYGTKEHIEAIKEMGPCEIHRRTFIHSFISH